ncbi:MAG: hypothetical protein QG597_82 [Actinomycetota bacterium]|nr:hypothetical protein [Actinomycetota bacterium]
MTPVRTLPIRLPPISGEALDSWLEAMAYRNATAFGDLLTAVGLKPYHGTATTGWIVTLSTAEAATIAAATGLTGQALDTMTLAHYAGRALTIDRQTRTLSRAFPWGGARGSRYCPTCLKETGGRWQLSWRLGWTFACAEHHCLLADACPDCGAVQRRRTHIGDLIPHPGYCAHPAAEATGRSPARCDSDLTDTDVEVFDPDHPAIRAQRIVNAILNTETITLGVYRAMPQPRITALADIRAIAGRALAYATTEDLNAVVPTDLLAAYHHASRHEDSRAGIARTDTKPGLAAPAQAATAAVGVVAALNALDRNDIDDAGEALRWMVTTSRQRGLQVTATNIGWAKNTSAVLTGVQLAALGTVLKPSDQLRYRIGSALPGYPSKTNSASASGTHHHVPSMLWPEWSLRLSIPNCHPSQLRAALSAALLLVNSRRTLADAVRLIDSPVEGHAVSRILQLLEKHNQWPSIRTALIRVADYLDANDVPIDYQRRRCADYAMLLPDKAWAQICRDTATPGPRSARARIARCFLFERLSGQPASASPWALDDSAFRTKTADFPRHLTPELAHALNEHAQAFLADQGIDDEPVTWQPPAGVLDGLDLPGTDPAAVDVAELHRVMAGAGITFGTAAARFHTSLDTLRYLLEIHPAPRADPEPGAPLPTPYNRAYANAKAALPRERLADLYERERMSLRDIAATVDVSRQTIASLARDYGLPLRESGRPARTAIDRAWLYNQYVTKRRALPEIAKEAGMTTANMARWAKTHSIPMRGRGGRSHSSSLAAESVAAEAPELIRPALAGIGGRERLERFSASMRYRTLADAADSLGIDQVTLLNQINRIESELGTQLFVRAERCYPMRLTDDGARVVATVRACQRRGW